MIDLARNVSSRFTFDKTDETNPLWSPDGSRIAYSSERKAENLRDIFWKAAGGAGAEELVLEHRDNKALEDWSPDGKLLLYNIDGSLAAVPVSGDRQPFPVLKAGPGAHLSRWPLDRLRCARGRKRRGLRRELSSLRRQVQISNSGGTEPTWSGNGKEIFLISGAKFKVVEVKASGTNFEAGIPKDLFEVQQDPTIRRSRYVVAPDGKRFLFVTVPKRLDTVPFMVVQNWQSLLKH